MLNKINIMTILLLFTLFGILYAQAPPMNWHVGYGTDNGEHVHEGMQTSDGGYIGIGQTDEDDQNGFDLMVIKIDKEGQYDWMRIIGSENTSEVGYSVKELNDGFIISGGLYLAGHQQRYLAKLDYNGNTLWEKFYDADGHSGIRSIAVTKEENLVLTGYVNAERGGFIFISTDSQGFIMKTDSNGNVIWDKPIEPPQGTKVKVDHNNAGYVIASTVWVVENENQDVQLLKYDHNGDEYWSNTYGDYEWDQCYDFDLTDDGGYICAGHSRSYGVNWDFYLLKIGSDGEEEWHNTFGQPRGYDAEWIHDESYGVRQTPDGGYVMTGGTGDEYPYSETGSSLGPSDIWMVYVVKTDPDGKLEWQGVYGGTDSHDAGEYLGLTNDGGYIIFVDADSVGDMEPNNFGFMKIGGK